MKLLLAPAELLYRGINRARRSLYRSGALRSRRLHRPVISVGNIAAGGTGKTPAVIAIARFLESRGLRVAVLTRGYGRADSTVTGPVQSLDAARYGDEPVLIKRSINGAVLVGSNRYDNGHNFDCDVFVLDDGFQHLQLHRDFDLVIDAPSRFHREGRSALRDADAVIPRKLRLAVPENLRGRRVFAFAGLADNEQFFASLRAAGLDLAGTRGFPDHHRYSEADLDAIREAAAGAPIVTTEKDAVKLDASDVTSIPAELEIDAGVLEKIGAAVASPRERRHKRKKSALLQRVEYLLYRGVARLVTSASDASLLRWGTRLGALSGKILRKRDRLAMRNLRYVYPQRDPRELRRILNECWKHFGRETLASVRMQNLEFEEILAGVDVENAHLVDEALARGNGVVLITAHWGGWEVAGVVLMSMVPKMRTVARPLDNELLERDLQRLRAKTGAQMIDRRRAARALMRALAENAAIALLPDQAVQPREGVLVPFLGRPAWTTPAPAKLALKSHSTIVFAFCIPDGVRHRLWFEEAIVADQSAESENDPVMLTKRINDVLSRRIDERPELWLWMHDRWKGTAEREVSNGV